MAPKLHLLRFVLFSAVCVLASVGIGILLQHFFAPVPGSLLHTVFDALPVALAVPLVVSTLFEFQRGRHPWLRR